MCLLYAQFWFSNTKSSWSQSVELLVEESFVWKIGRILMFLHLIRLFLWKPNSCCGGWHGLHQLKEKDQFLCHCLEFFFPATWLAGCFFFLLKLCWCEPSVSWQRSKVKGSILRLSRLGNGVSLLESWLHRKKIEVAVRPVLTWCAFSLSLVASHFPQPSRWILPDFPEAPTWRSLEDSARLDFSLNSCPPLLIKSYFEGCGERIMLREMGYFYNHWGMMSKQNVGAHISGYTAKVTYEARSSPDSGSCCTCGGIRSPARAGLRRPPEPR